MDTYIIDFAIEDVSDPIEASIITRFANWNLTLARRAGVRRMLRWYADFDQEVFRLAIDSRRLQKMLECGAQKSRGSALEMYHLFGYSPNSAEELLSQTIHDPNFDLRVRALGVYVTLFTATARTDVAAAMSRYVAHESNISTIARAGIGSVFVPLSLEPNFIYPDVCSWRLIGPQFKPIAANWISLWWQVVRADCEFLAARFLESEPAVTEFCMIETLRDWHRVFGEELFNLARDRSGLFEYVSTGDIKQAVAAAEMYHVYHRVEDTAIDLEDHFNYLNCDHSRMRLLQFTGELYAETANESVCRFLARCITEQTDPISAVARIYLGTVLRNKGASLDCSE